MFTGIIIETGVLKDVRRMGESLLLRIGAPGVAAAAESGDSIAVDGVCLTATLISGGEVSMDVGEETYRRTTLNERKIGDKVNIEPSLLMGGKVGGHIVTGHVDAVGHIAGVKKKTTEVEYRVAFPPELKQYIAAKGSVAVDGISLTVGEVRGNEFSLHIIPHTLEKTTLKDKGPGAAVNLEADVLARYVVNAMDADGGKSGLLEKMVRFGYMKGSGE